MLPPRMTSLRAIGATLVLCVLAAGAPGAASASTAAPIRAERAFAGAQPEVAAPSPVWRALIERVLHELRPTMLARLHVEAPPVSKPPWIANGARALWLDVDLRSPHSGEDPLRGEWEAYLLAGALRDLGAARGRAPLAGVTVRSPPDALSGRCCSRVERRLGARPPATLAHPAAAPDRRELRDRLERLGLTLTSLTVRKSLGLALEVHVTTGPKTRPVEVLEARSLIAGPRYDGVLFEVSDSSGDVVFRAATSTRVPTSASLPICYVPCSLGRPTPASSHAAPLPLSVPSLLVCGGRDTMLAPGITGQLFHICTADPAGAPIVGVKPVYCTAIVVGGVGHVLTMQIVRVHTVVSVVAFGMTDGGTWYQTVSARPPAGGWLECRVLVDGRLAVSRRFEIL